MVIYKTVNKINGMYYIGKDRNNDPSYLGSGIYLKRAIQKYGTENFEKTILYECSSIDEMNKMEAVFVDDIVVNDKNSYNIALGGQGGEILTWKQKIDLGVNDKISKSKLGRKLTSKHIKSIKDGMAKYKSKPKVNVHKQPNKAHFGKSNPFYGKKHTGDLSRFGKHCKGVTPTNANKVFCINNNTLYESATDAARKLKFDNVSTARRGIADVCKNRRDDYRGYKFVYA